MGNPTQTTTYELCIYDSRGVQMAMAVPPGAGWEPARPDELAEGLQVQGQHRVG
jgi:hypothetical protein